jgi:MinD-like ATPase involved in chromosome partitioning or flagellar assembly
MAYEDRPGDEYTDERRNGELASPPAPRVDPWSDQHLADARARGVADSGGEAPPPEPVAPHDPTYRHDGDADDDPDTYSPYRATGNSMPPPKPSPEWAEYTRTAPPPQPAAPPVTEQDDQSYPEEQSYEAPPSYPEESYPEEQSYEAPQSHAAPSYESPTYPAEPRPAAAPPPTPRPTPPQPAPPVPAQPGPPMPATPRVRPATPPVAPIESQQFAAPPTAADFAARRVHTPQLPPATMGLAGLVRRVTLGRVAPAPSQRELDHRHAVTTVRRNFGGLRQITVVNPKGGAGKTVAVLMTAMTFGQQRGGYVLSWDNNETQGTLGMRAQQDFHHRTVRDLLAELGSFAGESGRVGDLSRYVRSQGEAMFDVLASDESATAGEMLTAQAFRNLREVVSRFYKLIIVDTGNNVRAENWQAAIEATDQLVVPMSARGDSAETAARMLDHLEQTGRNELVRRAVSVISLPAHTKGTDLAAIRNHFAARTRAVLVAPYEPLLDSGEPIRYEEISQKSREAWLTIAAAVAEGL